MLENDNNNENVSLASAVQSAMDEQDKNKDESKPNEEIQQEAASESKKIEEETPKVVDQEIEDAVAFYRALRDPSQQSEIIQNLALRAGLIQPQQQLTQKEERSYGDLLNQILGEEYPDLKDKLGKVFNQFEKESDAKLNRIRAELEHERRAKAQENFESEFTTFLSDNKITEEVAEKMIKEIQELPPSVGPNGKKIPLTQYLTKIHKLVAVEKKIENDNVKRTEKIHQNLKERSTNLSSDISDDRLKKGSKLPSIRESVEAASRGVTFDE